MTAAKPNLLLCFDAFGTLFSPKGPVAQQYAEVARQCDFTGFSDKELQSRLLEAIKDEREQNPNYGKATGLGATQWWTNVSRSPDCFTISRLHQALLLVYVSYNMLQNSSVRGIHPCLISAV